MQAVTVSAMAQAQEDVQVVLNTNLIMDLENVVIVRQQDGIMTTKIKFVESVTLTVEHVLVLMLINVEVVMVEIGSTWIIVVIHMQIVMLMGTLG